MSLLDRLDKCPMGEHVEIDNNMIEPDVMSTYCMRCEYNRSSKASRAYTHIVGSAISCSAGRG